MDFEKFKEIVRMKFFFEEYTPIQYSSRTRQKMNRKDSAGREIDFTEKEFQQIQKGVKKFMKDLKSFPFKH
jgi:hypothetical protein